MTGHTGIIKSVNFSYDDKYLISAAEDKYFKQLL